MAIGWRNDLYIAGTRLGVRRIYIERKERGGDESGRLERYRWEKSRDEKRRNTCSGRKIKTSVG